MPPVFDTGRASLATGAPAPAPIGPAPAPIGPAPAPVVAAPAVPAPAPAPAAPAEALAPRGESSQLPTLPILTVLAAGGLALTAMLRRRRKGAATQQDLDVVATRSLGGKAKIVWLAAGEREIVVSVTNQQVRLLSQWRRNRATGAPEARALPPGRHAPAFGASPAFAAPAFASARASASSAIATGDDDEDDGAEFAPITPIAPPAAPPRAPRTSSPAVSGILKLRERAAHLDDEIATGDPEADEQWARDILSAMRSKR